MSTIKVQLVNSQSDDPVTDLTVPNGTTVEAFLNLNNVKSDNASITMRVNGQQVDYDLCDEIPDGARITVTPVNVKGASPTVSVQLVNSQSDDPVTELVVPDGTTVGQFLDLNNVKTENASVTLRLDGQSLSYDLDDDILDGTRITVTPVNVKGA